MSDQNGWEGRYRAGSTPWDVGRPDFNLIDMVLQRPIAGCRALEIGCGTGIKPSKRKKEKKYGHSDSSENGCTGTHQIH